MSEIELRALSAAPRDVSYDASTAVDQRRDSAQPDHATAKMSRLSDAALERRVKRKLDFILLPFLSLLFLFNSLDKSNIGSAETGHFTTDTGLPASALNVSVACFFAAFVTLQPIGAALGRKYGMARYVPACMTLWGLSTAAHIIVRKQWQLVVLRTLVGALEAGFYPTTVSYLSLFYTRFEFAKRLGMFYGQAAVAGALGGLLSWAVFRQFPDPPPPAGPPEPHFKPTAMDGSWKPWQVLFLIEGVATMIIALVGFVWLPHSARTAWFFSEAEREYAEARIIKDQLPGTTFVDDANKAPDEFDNEDDDILSRPSMASPPRGRLANDFFEQERLLAASRASVDSSHSQHFRTLARGSMDDRGLSRSDIISAITDWKIWFLLCCNILSAIPATAFSVFLPLVVKGLSQTSTAPHSGSPVEMAPATANLLTVPPFFAGAAVLWVFTAWSDARQDRFIPILWGLLILLLGLTATVLLPTTAHAQRYVALVVLLAGSFVPSPLTVAWLTNNTPQPGKRAIVLGINGWGNLAGVLSALLFAPRYRESGYVLPFFITLGCVLVAFVGFAFFRALLVVVNQRREERIEGWDEDDREREMRFGDVGIGTGRRVGGWRKRLGIPLGGARVGDERLTFRYTL